VRPTCVPSRLFERRIILRCIHALERVGAQRQFNVEGSGEARACRAARAESGRNQSDDRLPSGLERSDKIN